jgi:5-methyltetrahydropteroyltriglutamate--homocysteine methyltransferase
MKTAGTHSPAIRTTTVGSYPVPEWLTALPSEQSLVDATRVVFDIQRQAGIDLPTDGELYRFDVNHPDTNGMIDYFVRRLGGIRSEIGRRDADAFRSKREMRFRSKPAGVVVGPVTEGALNLPDDCARAAAVAGGAFKFTLTSPYMLARTLLDEHYHDLRRLTLAVADALATQAAALECACVQVDEANVLGNPPTVRWRRGDQSRSSPPSVVKRCTSASATMAARRSRAVPGRHSSRFSTA